MKTFAALGAAILIAAASALWFTTYPARVGIATRPLPVNPNLPTFKPVPSPYDGARIASPRFE
jgi:hypothetical protein